QPDDGRRHDLADVSVAEQLLDELDRRGLAALQPDDRAHPLFGGERGHRSRFIEVAAKWPLAVDGLAGGECRGDELSMLRGLDRDGDDVDVWLGYELLVVREHGADVECLACCARGLRAVRAECPDLVVRQRAQCRDVGVRRPAPDGADPDDPHTQRQLRHFGGDPPNLRARPDRHAAAASAVRASAASTTFPFSPPNWCRAPDVSMRRAASIPPAFTGSNPAAEMS